MSAPEDCGPFRQLAGSSATAALARVFEGLKSSGLSTTYITISHTKVERGATAEPLERLLVDLETADVSGEHDREVVVRSVGGSHVVRTTQLTRYRRSLGDPDSVMAFLKERRLHLLCERTRWYESTSLLTGDWKYWLDPANQWPLWSCFVGCDSALGIRPPDAGIRSELPYELQTEADLWEGTLALMPFVAVRLKQDVIRIGDQRLRLVADRVEQATVTFEIGTFARSVILSNKIELLFKLLGEDQSVVHSGSIQLRQGELKYGVTLSVPEGCDDRRIFSTDLELRVNDTLLDRAISAFIRQINVSVSMKG
jgi:hypothetical protein